MQLSTKVLVGMALGIATGLFVGEPAGYLGIVGQAFVQLLQMTVLPYVMVSLITALGRLSYRQAGQLSIKSSPACERSSSPTVRRRFIYSRSVMRAIDLFPTHDRSVRTTSNPNQRIRDVAAHKKSSRKVRCPRGAEDDALQFREPVVWSSTEVSASLLCLAERNIRG